MFKYLFCFILFASPVFADFATEYKTELDYIEQLKPIVAKTNNEVLAERSLIEKIELTKLTEIDKTLLEEKAKKYDIFTRLKDEYRYEYLRTNLLERVDILSPSLLIAISGIETNWGRSHIVQEANSLYKEISWNTKGLKPKDEKEDTSYSIKIFESKEDSMRSFLLKINSSIDYAQVWNMRRLYRWRENIMQGRSMAHNFNLLSPLRNYPGLLDYSITFYKLDDLDRSIKYW